MSSLEERLDALEAKMSKLPLQKDILGGQIELYNLNSEKIRILEALLKGIPKPLTTEQLPSGSSNPSSLTSLFINNANKDEPIDVIARLESIYKLNVEMEKRMDEWEPVKLIVDLRDSIMTLIAELEGGAE